MLSEKLYRALLVAYPREHRREYGELMVQMFRDRMRRDGGGLGILRVWSDILVDLMTSALKEHSNGGITTTRTGAGGDSTVQTVVWATILFFGFPILREFIAAPLEVIYFYGGPCCQERVVFWTTSNVSYFVPFILMVVLYPFVRRLRHDLLSHLWLYVIIVGVGGTITVLPALGYFHSPSGQTYMRLLPTSEVVQLVAIVWLARKLSAVSFRHSLLFIGLTTVPLLQSPTGLIPSQTHVYPQIHEYPYIDWPLHLYITLLIGGTLLRGLAMWALIKEHTVTSSTKTLLPPLTAMVLLGPTLYGLVLNVWAPSPADYHWILPTLLMLLVPALAIAVTYAIRVRGPGEPQPGLKLQST